MSHIAKARGSPCIVALWWLAHQACRAILQVAYQEPVVDLRRQKWTRASVDEGECGRGHACDRHQAACARVAGQGHVCLLTACLVKQP